MVLVRVGVGLTRKKHRSGHGSTCFASGQKNRVQIKLENFDLFYHI